MTTRLIYILIFNSLCQFFFLNTHKNAKSAIEKMRFFIVMLFYCCSVYSYPLHGQIEKQAFETTLKAKIDTLQSVGFQHIAAEKIFFPEEIRQVYTQRSYVPIWIGDGKAAERINNYVNCIHRSAENGLLPRDYHLFSIAGSSKKHRQSK